MLQRIENFYLAILRVVVIAVAGLLLAAVVFFGLKSMGATVPAPKETPANPTVEAAAYKAEVLGTRQAPTTTGTQAEIAASGTRNEYVRVATLLHTYYKNKYGSEGILVDKLADWYATYEDAYASEQLKKRFASGLMERVSGLVADPDFAKWEAPQEFEPVLTKIIEAYVADFNRQVEETNDANEKAQAEHAASKIESMQMLYVAGGAFLAFLLIVFLSIIIRIERNLRPQPQS